MRKLLVVTLAVVALIGTMAPGRWRVRPQRRRPRP